MLRTITPPEPFLQAAVVAELTGSDTATALGVSAVSATPILVLCRKLIEAGYDPATSLEAWRDDVLCLTVRSIGEAAGLEINSHGSGFVRLRGRRTAPPVAPLTEAAPPQRGRRISHAGVRIPGLTGGRAMTARRRNKIPGQFSWRLIEMLESPAYRVLSLSAHRILDWIEIELAHHGGHDNGRLPVTFDDFVSYGIHRHAVAPAVRELEVLGFVRITERGRAGNAEFRSPNKFANHLSCPRD